MLGGEGQRARVISAAVLGWAGAYDSSQGCWRQSAAVALFSGISSNMGSKKSVKPAASSWDHSYFSTRTSKRPQGFSFVMCFRSPVVKTVEKKLTNTDRWQDPFMESWALIRVVYNQILPSESNPSPFTKNLYSLMHSSERSVLFLMRARRFEVVCLLYHSRIFCSSQTG